MSINVYWACIESEWMEASEPRSVYKSITGSSFIDKNNQYTRIDMCPSIREKNKNTFELKSIYDYNFSVLGNEVYTEMFDEAFFKRHVTIRDIDKKMFSFSTRYVFFTEEDSLLVNFYENPFLEDNNITKRCTVIPGSFDIGKWFRNTEFAFYLKKDIDTFKIEKDEVFCYITFLTDEKINFKQFVYDEKINSFLIDGENITNRYRYKNLKNYYKSFKNKKRILSYIKENLV